MISYGVNAPICELSNNSHKLPHKLLIFHFARVDYQSPRLPETAYGTELAVL